MIFIYTAVYINIHVISIYFYFSAGMLLFRSYIEAKHALYDLRIALPDLEVRHSINKPERLYKYPRECVLHSVLYKYCMANRSN
jgi:hypothetical protein